MKGISVIKEASYTVLSIIGEQKYINKTIYVKSNYTIIKNLEKSVLYYSCLTGELIEVFDMSTSYQYLVSHWFLIQEKYDEKKDIFKIQKLVRLIGKNSKKGYNYFEILTTTRCNANCFYCYESSFEKMTMNSNTAKDIVNFINRNKLSNEITIRWYGGEPLINQNAIDLICTYLKNYNINYNSMMISNGFLFNTKNISKAVNLWQLKNVRITIDGTEDIYNKVKDFKYSTSCPFKKILSNIDELILAGISVTIRLNIEMYNLEDNKILIDLLCEKYLGNKLIDFKLYLLNNTLNNSTIENKENKSYLCEELILLKFKIFEKGFNVNGGQLRGISKHYCLADSGRFLLIKPNGGIAYCSEDFNQKHYGFINDDIHNLKAPNLYEYLSIKTEICDDCPLYATCTPSVLCPACKQPICDELQKKLLIKDLEISILQEHRNYHLNRI